ncbi:hypothetical protein CEE37_04605 [candidate division LCP-89 bacterium B3_LCP]|uniref:PEGA domain-containing protein n=1 Tax=candidate division LCP-89 bacterium B3_LCP TaxID=2012998 RepID=A0A532V3S2_UNCL8|nr:MAG: hypothetical protein CEE37_04605 [candidate division LCP-89 bacterium B3_LCP]
MLKPHHTGIGRDQALITHRRKTLYAYTVTIILVVIALIVSVILISERKCTLLVQADHEDAYVVINGSVTNTMVGTKIRNLRPDTYTITVHLAGYHPIPSEDIVEVAAGKTIELSFQLEPIPPEVEIPKSKKPPVVKPLAQQKKFSPETNTRSDEAKEEDIAVSAKELETSEQRGTLKVNTYPIQGGIFVDDIFKGIGKVVMPDLSLGELIIRFGEVEGYRTPQPQKASLTGSWPYANLEGLYLPLIYITCNLDQSGRLITQKCEVRSGYYIDNSYTYDDPIIGPGIKYVDEIGAFVWEIGYAYSNRNPPGSDVIEINFDLPENWDGNKALELQIFGFASDKKYPFVISGQALVDVKVNDRQVVTAYHPAAIVGKSRIPDVNTLAVNSYLLSGKNQIQIQASGSSRCFFYLQKIVLL